MKRCIRPSLWPLLAAALLAGAACAPPIEREPAALSAPPAPAPAVIAAPPATPVPPVSPLATRQQRALSLQHRGELAAALVQWRILRVLAPEDPEIARQVAATRALIRRRTEALLNRGDTAEQTGDTANARTAYLRVLALDPANRQALARLRYLETERVYALQQARLDTLRARRSAALARKAAGPGGARGVAREGNGNGQERDYRDTGVALFEAGDYEASVLELKKYLGAFPEDEVAHGVLRQAERRLLAEGYSETEPLSPALPSAPATAAPITPAAREPAATTPPGVQSAQVTTAEDTQAAQELYEQGLRAHRRDIAAAIRLWEQSLERDPGHVQARLRLEQAQKMQRSLEIIDRQ